MDTEEDQDSRSSSIHRETFGYMKNTAETVRKHVIKPAVDAYRNHMQSNEDRQRAQDLYNRSRAQNVVGVQ